MLYIRSRVVVVVLVPMHLQHAGTHGGELFVEDPWFAQPAERQHRLVANVVREEECVTS